MLHASARACPSPLAEAARPLSPADQARLDAVADSWPPFTPEQRARLRPLLAGTLLPAASAASAA